MSNCEIHIETHKAKGRRQTSRIPKALGSDFVQIDERKIEDLIVATYKLSSFVNFYDGENVVMGNWSLFFGWESTSILAQIATLDIQKFTNDYKVVRRKIILLPRDEHHNHVDPYFNAIDAILKDLFQKVILIPNDLEIREYFSATSSTLEKLLNSIEFHVNQPEDINITFSNHLFNKKIQNLFGLLKDWKRRSQMQLYENLKSYPRHSPQYSLYLTFLQLFENAQNDLNTLTKRHLDFYYKEVLHLEPQNASPDYVHCFIEPYENQTPFLIEKNSVFLAGKDVDGNKKYYASTADATINKAQIEAIYGGFKKENTYYFEDLTELNATGESWNAFTTNSVVEQFGFVIASPLLFLKGGERTININFKKANGAHLELDISNYDFYLTGEEEWFQIQNPINDGSTLKLGLTSDDPSILPFDFEIHEGVEIDSEFPVLKIVSKNGRLSHFKFSRFNMEVIVSNYKQFKLFSDTGTIDHTKSFQPFGLIPKNGQSLTFSCKEFYQKKGANGDLIIETEEKTDNSIWSIYENTKLSHLVNGEWNDQDDWNTEDDYRFQNEGPLENDFTEDLALATSDVNGFLKIILNNGYRGETYLNNFIAQSKIESPDLPYIPTISSITFSYKANSIRNEVSFFNIYPKGYKKVSGVRLNVIPAINNDGELFIGIKDINPGNSLSLLFQIAEGSANPRQLPIDLKWSYLKGAGWNYFEPEAIGDETNGLTQSGIVQIQAPEDLNTENQTIFPKGIWWIRIELEERVDAICHLVGIHTQALKAVLFDHENIGLSYKENLASGVISKLLKPKNEIKKIEQPYVSFGGRLKDTDLLFYQRSCERLRHKEKAISIWDYETLILDNFPEVFRVKCLNHYRYDADEIHNSSAGYVTIIPVAKGLANDVPIYWKPLVDLGTMKRIKAFLEANTSPHARINVKPPKLEKLELVFNVKFRELPGADSRLYTQQLMDTINAFLSPWAYSNESTLEFQSEIEKSKLIQLVEMQTYVDYISEFKVNHHVLSDSSNEILQSFNDVEEIIPKTVYSLFVPDEHSITTITNICCT